MVKITFKDVGQGDSIIIEWDTDKSEHKIGIIDCKKKSSTNPILQHIIDNKISEIDFIILSHPHTDHYSGMLELFEYCKINNIIIKQFFHTLRDIDIEYWQYLEPNITNSKELFSVFEIVLNSYNKNLNQIINLDFNYRIDLNHNMYLKCLSPSHSERVEYLKALKYLPEKNRMKRSKVANLLSTMFKLSINDNYILFTSDSEKITFERLRDYNLDIFDNKINVLSQIPHHGSEVNHEISFWSQLKKDEKSDAIISAGEHKYNHPNYSVIKDFAKIGYNVNSTNIINGMLEHVNDIKSKSLVLDTDSIIAEDYYISGDKIFNF